MIEALFGLIPNVDVATSTVGKSRGQEFTATGTFNVPANVSLVWLTAVAPGGGGGGSNNANAGYPGGGGGGSGQAIVRWPMKVTAGGTVSVTSDRPAAAAPWLPLAATAARWQWAR